jgi:hypothetical protein
MAEDLSRIAMPERKAIIEAAAAISLGCAAHALPAQPDAARRTCPRRKYARF